MLNADDEYVSQFGRDFHGRVVTFGLHKPAEVSAQNIESRGPLGSAFDIVAEGERARATLPLLGEHNIYNALAAVAVGLQYGVPLATAAESLATLSAGDKRGEILHIAGATVINDCYNSNPKALDSMVQSLAQIPAQRRIVVAGEMLELGPAGRSIASQCRRHMAKAGIDSLFGVRGLAQAIVEGAKTVGMRAEFVNTPEEAGEWLRREVKAGRCGSVEGIARRAAGAGAGSVDGVRNPGRQAGLESFGKKGAHSCAICRKVEEADPSPAELHPNKRKAALVGDPVRRSG